MSARKQKTFTFNGRTVTLPENPTDEEIRAAIPKHAPPFMGRAVSKLVEPTNDPVEAQHRQHKYRRLDEDVKNLPATVPAVTTATTQSQPSPFVMEKVDKKKKKKETTAESPTLNQSEFLKMLGGAGGNKPGSVMMGSDGIKKTLNAQQEWVAEMEPCLLEMTETGKYVQYTLLTLPQDVKEMVLLCKEDGYFVVNGKRFLVRQGQIVDSWR